MKHVVLLIASALLLGACSLLPRHAKHPATSSAHAAVDAPVSLARMAAPDFAGIGPLRFGMTAAQMRAAWGAPLYGDAAAADGTACHYLSPTDTTARNLLFMVSEGHFGRVDVRSDPAIVAPGGGHIGMSALQIEKLYIGQVQVTPGKYNPDDRWLTVTSPHDAAAKLIFETDASGKVTSWRIGITPSIDYVEGCS